MSGHTCPYAWRVVAPLAPSGLLSDLRCRMLAAMKYPVAADIQRIGVEVESRKILTTSTRSHAFPIAVRSALAVRLPQHVFSQ